MVSARAKGSQFELELQKAFESEGWICHRAYPSLQRAGPDRFFSKEQDIYGIYDLLCTRQSGGLLWVQVCAEKQATDHRRKMELFLRPLTIHHPIRVSSILALRYPRKVWRMQAFDAAGMWFDIKSPVDVKPWVRRKVS